MLESMLPDDWSWEGKRVLDFGCGSGRVLRHFLDEAQEAEFWGCDLHGPSIEWVKENLSPPLHVFQNGVDPPLPLEDGHFDLVWATSVFTHITENWADWLLELHRVLAPGGLLISTYLGDQKWQARFNEPYDEDRVGMVMLRHSPEAGDGLVFHSEWWLREHWGRAFEILEVDRPRAGSDGVAPIRHTYLLARKLPVSVTADQLERANPEESRELESLHNNVRILLREPSSGPSNPRLQREFYRVTHSWSWRLTAPLRALNRWARGLRAKLSRARSGP
jgi:SAM-dependent methyltransferase